MEKRSVEPESSMERGILEYACLTDVHLLLDVLYSKLGVEYSGSGHILGHTMIHRTVHF